MNDDRPGHDEPILCHQRLHTERATCRPLADVAVTRIDTGQFVDRDTLLDRCWGAEYFPESRTLDMQIAKLRKRIERDATAPTIIETVRGAGYRYRAR